MAPQDPRNLRETGTQHYVPRFLLRNFSGTKNSQCFVFDKYEDRVFETNVRNVASEHKFYDVSFGGFVFSVDPLLQDIETATAAPIRKIIHFENLKDLSEDERATIAQFVAIQIARTYHTRVQLAELSEAIECQLRSRGIDPQQVKGFSRLTPQDAKLLSIQQILEADEIVPYIYDKDWLLFRTQRANPLFISDNPVTRQNLRKQESLGIGVPGVEIYLPISATLSLVFLCCSWKNDCRSAIESSRLAPPQSDSTPLHRLLGAIESGEPLDCDPGNVENLNSLQIKNAERFIFSSTNDFSLVRHMLAKSVRYRQGPRLRGF